MTLRGGNFVECGNSPDGQLRIATTKQWNENRKAMLRTGMYNMHQDGVGS